MFDDFCCDIVSKLHSFSFLEWSSKNELDLIFVLLSAHVYRLIDERLHALVAFRQQTSNTLSTMKVIFAVCLLIVSAYCALAIDEQLNDSWTLFKRVFKKSYATRGEETNRWVNLLALDKVNLLSDRRTIWEQNLAQIRKHNLEHDMGLHKYTMGMNRFGDLVRIWNFYVR